MISEIYYFSGTGNSLAISRKINDKLTGINEIIPISKNPDGITTNADRIGIVFPVYYHNIPRIVRCFIEDTTFEKTPYIFAIATCNIKVGHSLFSIDKQLKNKGQSLSLGMVVHMPGNAKINTREVEQEKLLNSTERVKEITNYIEMKKYMIEGDNSLTEYIWSSFESGLATGIAFNPNRYKVSDSCNACGICEKVCPINNISRKDGKPIWKNKCENCLACFHWCPKEAISLDNFIIKNRPKYHHPEITVKDMFLT